MKRFLKYLSIFVVILILAAVVFVKLFDFNNYKTQIEKLLHKYADIDVKINGDLAVALSLKPTIEVNDVSLALTDGQKIAQIGNALVQFSIMPLLHKELVIDSLETSNTQIFYNDTDSIDIHLLTADIESIDQPIQVEFATSVSEIQIDGSGTISSLRDLQKDNFNNMDIDAQIAAMGYTLSFKGNLDELQQQIAAVGQYNLTYKNNHINGDVELSMAGEKPYINLTAGSDKINAASWQTAQNNFGGWLISNAYAEEYISGTDIPYSYLKMANADISLDFKKIIVDPKTVVENIQADISVKDGALSADIKKAETLGMQINGTIRLDSPKSLPYIKLNIKGNTFDLQQFTTPDSQKHSYLLHGGLISTAAAASFMPSVDIPYEYLRMANGSVNLSLQKLKLMPHLIFTDVKAKAVLQSGNLATEIQNLTAGKGKIAGNIDIDAKNQTAKVDLKATDVVLQDLYTSFADAANTELYIKSGGVSNALVNVTTGGKNTDAYLRNLNGQIIFLADKSVVKIKSLERLQGNIIVQILQNLKLNLTNKEMSLSCAVMRSDIQSGRMNFPKGIVFDAKDLYLVADGHIDLNDEKINLDIQPFSGKITDTNISSILGSLLKIKGTISNPKISLNSTATAKSVIGAIATAGAYNVGDMMLSADNAPCHTALAGTQYADYFKADKSVRGAVSKGYTNTQETVKNIGKDIKDSAKQLKNNLKGLFK